MSDRMKSLIQPCGCNKPYVMASSGYTLCLECGCQYPTVVGENNE